MNTSLLSSYRFGRSLRRTLCLSLAFGAALCSGVSSATAEIIYEGIGRPSSGLGLILDADDFRGVRINTGASGWSVSAIQLLLTDDQGGPADQNGTPQVNVFGALNAPYQKPNPAEQVGMSFDFTSTLAPWGSTPITKIVELQPVTPVLLEPETDYWFIVSLASGSRLVMKGTSDPIGVTSKKIIGSSETAFTNFNVAGGGLQMNIIATPTAVPDPMKVDVDADGIADFYENAYLSTLGLLTATGDYDGDGVSDLNEFIAYSDATNPADRLRIVASSTRVVLVPSVDGTTTTPLDEVTLTWTSRPERGYFIEWSADLTTWVRLGGPAQAGAIGQSSRTFTLPAAMRRFYRVVAEIP